MGIYTYYARCKMHDARCTVRSSGVLQNWLSKLRCSHPTHFCEELHSKHRMLSTESPAVARARVGVDTYRNTLSHKAALVTLQLLSKVSCLPSRVSSLRPLHSWQCNVPTVTALNVFLTALSYILLFYVVSIQFQAQAVLCCGERASNLSCRPN